MILLQNPLFSEKWASLQEKTSMISTPIFFKNPVSRGFAAESIYNAHEITTFFFHLHLLSPSVVGWLKGHIAASSGAF